MCVKIHDRVFLLRKNMWHTEIESKIVEHGRRKEWKELNKYRRLVLTQQHEANYMLNRFLEEYGDTIDKDIKAEQLYKTLFEEYTQMGRLLTIISSYEKQ